MNISITIIPLSVGGFIYFSKLSPTVYLGLALPTFAFQQSQAFYWRLKVSPLSCASGPLLQTGSGTALIYLCPSLYIFVSITIYTYRPDSQFNFLTLLKKKKAECVWCYCQCHPALIFVVRLEGCGCSCLSHAVIFKNYKMKLMV